MPGLLTPLLLGLALLLPSPIQSSAYAQAPSAQNAELERKKLELEIRDLSKPWYSRSEYWSAILPSVIGVGTLLVLYFNGYFQAEAIRLENKRTQLEKDIQQFESQKAELNRQVKDGEAALASLAAAEISFFLERLVRVIVPPNVQGVQHATNIALGLTPNEIDLAPITLNVIGHLLAKDDSYASKRLDILRSYIERPTTPSAAKDAPRAILAGREGRDG